MAFPSLLTLPSGQKLHEFLRGVKRCVSIYSLAFEISPLFAFPSTGARPYARSPPSTRWAAKLFWLSAAFQTSFFFHIHVFLHVNYWTGSTRFGLFVCQNWNHLRIRERRERERDRVEKETESGRERGWMALYLQPGSDWRCRRM